MTIEELITDLKEIIEKQKDDLDQEDDHVLTDHRLLEFINNDEVKSLFESIRKWYS